MRVLVVSDIHGNIAALEAVVGSARGAYDIVWCLGDVVGYGPSPNECVEWVSENAALCVIGNHDWAVLGREGIDIDTFSQMARQAAMWTRDILTAANRDYLDLKQMAWEQKRVSYPIALTQSRMRIANLPHRLINRLNYGW